MRTHTDAEFSAKLADIQSAACAVMADYAKLMYEQYGSAQDGTAERVVSDTRITTQQRVTRDPDAYSLGHCSISQQRHVHHTGQFLVPGPMCVLIMGVQEQESHQDRQLQNTKFVSNV